MIAKTRTTKVAQNKGSEKESIGMFSDPNIAILESSYNWWNNAVLFLLICAGVAAIGIAVASICSARKGQLLSKAKDLEVAALVRDAASLKRDVAVAQAQAAQANEKAEAERLRRAQLEISFEPRAIAFSMASLRHLRLFPGANVVVSCAGADDEIKGLAINLCTQLEMSCGWKVTRGDIHPTGYTQGTGVLILSHRTDPEPPSIYNDAAKILQFVLNDNGIEAVAMVFREIPENVVQVTIMAKPPRYFESRQVQKQLEQRGPDFGKDPNTSDGRSRQYMEMLADPEENLKYRLRYNLKEREEIVKKYSAPQ